MSVAQSNAVRRAALGGIIGPVVFVAAWLCLGLGQARYSAVHDPISDLAGVHASSRIAMTTAFVLYAAGMGLYAIAVRATPGGPAWIAAALTGAMTLGVAAFPLDHSSTVDRIHGAFAGAGYCALAATALLCAFRLTRLGRRGWARAAAAAGVVSGISLSLTLAGSFEGLFQRAGLTAGDIWVVASAVAILRAPWATATTGR